MMKFELLESRRPAAGLDFTGNGIVDTDDLEWWCDLVADPIGVSYLDETFDIDGNGRVENEDLDAFVAHFGTVTGDFNFDGVINAYDIELVGPTSESAWHGRSYKSGLTVPVANQDSSDWDRRGIVAKNLSEQNGTPLRPIAVDYALAVNSVRGDFNVDGVFNSDDFVKLCQMGCQYITTEEIVDLFIEGHYSY